MPSYIVENRGIELLENNAKTGKPYEDSLCFFRCLALRRSHRHFSSTMYLNLYENHFSYIKDLARHSKSFCCSRCGKYWKRASNLRQHEKNCDGKVRLKYPGGAYHVPKTVFKNWKKRVSSSLKKHAIFLTEPPLILNATSTRKKRKN